VALYEASHHDGGSVDPTVPDEMRAAVADIQRGLLPATTIEDKTGNTWFMRRVSQRTPDFGVIAIDLGRAPKDMLVETRQRLDEALSDAAATLERLDVARTLNEAKMRSETELLREALIGSVSHELRTPLASILGAATVLTQSPTIDKDERLKSLAAVVRDEAERLNNDIQNLLDATRISRGQVKPRMEWIEPQDIVNSALERRRRRLANHTIAITMDTNLPLIYVDPVLVEQAFVQVVDNAAKYSPLGSTINVAAKRNGRDVIFAVHDSGAGLTQEELSHLGERFFRGSRHSSIASGSGLGLWIAKAFVAANGGRLQAASHGVDQGTTVSILLPLNENAPQTEADPDD
jgi:two-component system sensor histidine kinase KdpD